MFPYVKHFDIETANATVAMYQIPFCFEKQNATPDKIPPIAKYLLVDTDFNNITRFIRLFNSTIWRWVNTTATKSFSLFDIHRELASDRLPFNSFVICEKFEQFSLKFLLKWQLKSLRRNMMVQNQQQLFTFLACYHLQHHSSWLHLSPNWKFLCLILLLNHLSSLWQEDIVKLFSLQKTGEINYDET